MNGLYLAVEDHHVELVAEIAEAVHHGRSLDAVSLGQVARQELDPDVLRGVALDDRVAEQGSAGIELLLDVVVQPGQQVG